MNKFMIIFLAIFIGLNAMAKPKEAATPQDVCKSIDSDKYVAQCESAIYKRYFDSKAVNVCFAMKTDYDKKSCMETIRDKEYTAGNISDCLKTKKIRVHKCLQLNGVERKLPVPATESETTIEN